MSQLELFSKSLARELFKRIPSTDLTAADIRRGAHSLQLANIINDFSKSKLNLSILELQDESIDELLSLLKPFCFDKAKAPVICLDYLQIVPSSKDSTKLGVDDSVRKLKKFQRDTNTTFIVISSFNRDNYTQGVSFESFKESGNIEYTADVVWALQLFVLNFINPNNIADSRKKLTLLKRSNRVIFNSNALKIGRATTTIVSSTIFRLTTALLHVKNSATTTNLLITLPSTTNCKTKSRPKIWRLTLCSICRTTTSIAALRVLVLSVLSC